MNSPRIVGTGDGSETLYLPEIDEHYHSTFGAIQESEHIFISNGLKPLLANQKPITIFEVGFGTGLNAYLTLLQSGESGIKIDYHTIEKFPLSTELIQRLNFSIQLNNGDPTSFLSLHTSSWAEPVNLSDRYTLHKYMADLQTFSFDTLPKFDLVYFDAFSPEKQPELWRAEILERIAEKMEKGGRIVTYCAKGVVRRTLQQCGFYMERLPGPPGKREMLRGTKL